METQRLVIPYRPLPKQRNFHASPSGLKIFLGGVGGGKTKAGAAEAVKRALENPGVDGMIVAPYYKVLHRVTLRAFLELLPKEIIVEHNKGQNYVQLLNGTRVYYASADNPASLEGSNLGWAWGDELRYWKRDSFNILLARIRVRCPCPGAFFTTTPDMGWLYDVFGPEALAKNPDTSAFRASSEENPYLPADFCTTLKNQYDEKLYAAYVRGEWVKLEGNVFVFEDERHIQYHLEDTSKPVDVAFDPGFRRSAILFLQKHSYCEKHGKKDCVHVLGELMKDDKPTVDLVGDIRSYASLNRWKLGTIYVDPAANSSNITVGFSDVDVLERQGWSVRWTTDPDKRRILSGVRLIQNKLIEGSLFFSPILRDPRGIVNSLKSAEYPNKQGEEPVKDGVYDHARDALRYYLVNTCELPRGSKVLSALA